MTFAQIVRRLAVLSGAASIVMIASGHVGSPDVYFDGHAGPYPVHVVIRSPDVIPARAEIIVKVSGGEVRRVTATSRAWTADERGAPPPDDAVRVPGDPTLWTLNLWVMRQGPLAVLIHVEGAAGGGTVTVPFTAVAQRVLGMNRGEAIALTIAALFLVTGLLTIFRAAAGEATVPPDEAPDEDVRARGLRARSVGAVLVVLILAGGKVWWNYEDSAYARSVYRATPMRVTVRDDSSATARPPKPGRTTALARILHIGIGRAGDDNQRRWLPLIPDHGKLMHLLIVKADGLGAMAHLHPLMRDSLNFESALPMLPAGKYLVFADVVHENGFAETLSDSVALGASQGLAWKPSDPDDATFAGPGTGTPYRFDDGMTLAFETGNAKHIARADAGLRFTLRDERGAVMQVAPYMGMSAHALVVRNDGSVYEHLHPMGNAPQIGGMGSMASEVPGTFSFPWSFPKAGSYRIWVQFRTASGIRTAAFDVSVN